MSDTKQALSDETLARGVAHLCALDPDLKRIHAELGMPPMWGREPGFPTLVHIILEQQVSLASARAAFTKLEQATGGVTPEKLLAFSDEELKAIGFSRQKTAYCRGLALAVVRGELDLEQMGTLDDTSIRETLLKLKGIGHWTVDIYLLMCLLRPDAWPSKDLALAAAVKELKGLTERPGEAELETIASAWRPWRAVAARLLWQYYLRKRK